MDQIKQVVLSSVLNNLAEPSGARLSEEEAEALTVLLDQMAPAYPHQQLTDETGEIWREAFETLTKKHSLRRMRIVLGDFLVKPGQKFFPHPSEISEALEDLVAKEKAELRKRNPFVPCNRREAGEQICHDGMVFVNRDGTPLKFGDPGPRFAADCDCKKRWRATMACAKESA